MTIYLNNCRNRDHAGLFGPGALFDFELTGRQAEMAQNLKPGDECIVASKGEPGMVVLTTYWYSHEAVEADPERPGVSVRVLYGQQIGDECLPKGEAVKNPGYAIFFDKNGNFKRPSEIRPPKRLRSAGVGSTRK